MTWDPTPWVVGGGAEHSPEVARLLAYAATGGRDGIVAPTDLKVQALAVPGNRVRVAPGAAVMLNRSPGATAQQSYVARNPSEHQSDPITATGTGAGRSDLVVVRVEDPQYSPWPTPADPTSATYVRTHVIENVPASTRSAAELNLGYPAIALARIDKPASRADITADQIVDLRSLASARSERRLMTQDGITSLQYLTSTSFVNWPSQTKSVAVPEWANYMLGRFEMLAGHFGGGDTAGQLRMMIGAGPGQGKVVGTIGYNQDWGTDPQRVHLLVVGYTSIVESMGLTRTLTIQGNRTSGHPGYLGTISEKYALWDIQFEERPV